MPAWAGVALICCCSLRSQQPFANPFKIRFASQQVFEAGVNSDNYSGMRKILKLAPTSAKPALARL